MFRRSITRLIYPFLPIRRVFLWAWVIQHRERVRLAAEISQMRGLMPLLMKQRNGYRWSDVERKKIRVQLRRLASVSPYLVLFVAPGGFLVLPVLAWWLDRRRQQRDANLQKSVSK